MLHPSLTELAASAPECADPATVRGVLAESLELLANALNHKESPAALTSWLSGLITDALHSPGAREMTGGATLVLTSTVGRGDAWPTSPVRWLTVLEDEAGSDQPVREMLHSMGFTVGSMDLSPAPRRQWEERIAANSDAESLAAFLDAGTWVADAVHAAGHDASVLLDDALAHRPPSIQVYDGLPDRLVTVSIRNQLVIPTAKLARWAAYAAGSHAASTTDRLRDARAAGTLTSDEADHLTQAWISGLELQGKRWLDHVHEKETTAEAMPSLQRSTFGAATRLVAEVAHSVADRV